MQLKLMIMHRVLWFVIKLATMRNIHVVSASINQCIKLYLNVNKPPIISGFYVLSVGGVFALVGKGVIVSTYALSYFFYFGIAWAFTKLPPVRRFLDNRVPQLTNVNQIIYSPEKHVF